MSPDDFRALPLRQRQYLLEAVADYIDAYNERLEESRRRPEE